MDLNPDTVVDDRYHVEARLGEGGMAAVWRVRHGQLGTFHALKVLHVASPAIRQRMLQEGRLQGHLRHPNVVAVTDVVTVGGAPGLVMELVEGPSLDRLLATRRLSIAEVDALARGILDGAAAAHAAGLVHRDLKPGNVLIATSQSGLVPKVADFGLAKALDADRRVIATRSGATMGSPAYMAPEQIRDASSVDARADVFALGVLLYEMLAGARPFEGSDTFALYEAITRGDHVPITERVADLPERMATAVEGALRVSPGERFADAGALRDAWTGTAAACHVTWDPDLLASASALTSRPPAETDSRATVDLDALPDAPMQTATPRRPRRLWLAVACALVLGPLWLLWPTEPVGGFTATSTPSLSSADDTAALERAWRALLEADVPRATRDAQALVDAHPDAIEPALVLYASLRIQGRHPAADEVLATPGLALDARDGDLAALAHAATSADANQRVRAWSQGHPESVLAALLVAEGLADTVEERTADAVGFRSAHPDLPVAWMLESRRLRSAGEDAAAVAALARARELAPDSPWLLYETGRLLGQHGEWDAARDALHAAIERDPELTDARMRLALILLHVGDDVGAAREADALRSAPLRDRLPFAHEYAFALLGHGRLSEAVALVDDTVALAEAEAHWSALGRLALVEFSLHDVAIPYTPAYRAAGERLRAVAALPGMPANFAKHLQTSVVAVDGELAAIDGDLERARTVAARLEEMGAHLQAQRVNSTLAIAEDASEVGIGSCMETCMSAHALEIGFGRVELANTAWKHLPLHTCSDQGFERLCSAEAQIRRADMALQADDIEAARAHAAAARALWRAPDPDLPAARRLREVEAALAE